MLKKTTNVVVLVAVFLMLLSVFVFGTDETEIRAKGYCPGGLDMSYSHISVPTDGDWYKCRAEYNPPPGDNAYSECDYPGTTGGLKDCAPPK